MDELQIEHADNILPGVKPKITQTTASVANSQNIVKQHKLLSLIGQIFNMQYTGVQIQLHLPIENISNLPLFGLAVSPMYMTFQTAAVYNQGTNDLYNVARHYFNRGWILPTDKLTREEVGDAVTVLETDDISDLTYWSMFHTGWRGSVQIMLKMVANMTTQGKVAVSRGYDVQPTSYIHNYGAYKTFTRDIVRSQQDRRKNAFLLHDFSRGTDLMLNCPYSSRYAFQSCARTMGFANSNIARSSVPPTSWIWFDIVGALSPSAGASTVLFEVWHRAGPDFEFLYPMIPTQASQAPESGARDITEGFYRFGHNHNVDITGPSKYTMS